jgi:uncharacterized protein YjiS (DUF1127 family)
MLHMFIRRLAAWHRRHEAIRNLQAMDDRLLADVGTQRKDIPCFVLEADNAC